MIFARVVESQIAGSNVYSLKLREYITTKQFRSISHNIQLKVFDSWDDAVHAATMAGFRTISNWQDAYEVFRAHRYQTGRKWQTL
jgi:hypothetical protein